MKVNSRDRAVKGQCENAVCVCTGRDGEQHHLDRVTEAKIAKYGRACAKGAGGRNKQVDKQSLHNRTLLAVHQCLTTQKRHRHACQLIDDGVTVSRSSRKSTPFPHH